MTTTRFSGTGRSMAVLTTAAALSMASMAACSSSGKSNPTVDSAFVAKANAICAVAVARQSGHALPVANFDPLHAKAQDLPAVGKYFATYGGVAMTASQLDKLAPPTKQKNEWTTLLGLVDQDGVNADRQIAVADRSDVAEFEKTVTTARSLAERIDQIGPKVGFKSDSPCRKVFG
jgi:hypothetical protein